MRGYVVISLVLLACTVNPERRPVVRPPQIVELTGAAIDDAIRIGTDAAATRKFLAPFQLQSHAGWGDAPMLGSFSTPFSRVVQAAAVARKEGRAFSATDVAPAGRVRAPSEVRSGAALRNGISDCLLAIASDPQSGGVRANSRAHGR